MDKVLRVVQVVLPIFVAVILGMLAKRKKMLTPEENRGLQQFVVKFALPCVVFQSCLTARMGVESLSSMALAFPMALAGTLWSFWARKKKYPYHNLPMLFCAQETGMLGIPLWLVLFGTDQAYRMGILDLTQALTAYPVIAILSADTGEDLPVKQVVKKVLTSPLLIICALGLTLNLTGIAGWLESLGALELLTGTAGFISQPISAIMLFSVGYNFSLARGSREAVFKISAIHFGMYLGCGLLAQALLFLLPGVDVRTRWALLLYCLLPASYLAPGLGKNQEDYTVSSGVCSVTTVVCLAAFCAMAAFVA